MIFSGFQAIMVFTAARSSSRRPLKVARISFGMGPFGDITPLIPAAAIALLTVAVNFVVDWMLFRSSGLKEV